MTLQFPQGRSSQLTLTDRLPALTSRELAVLRFMCSGFVADADLAAVLVVSESTAHYHVGQLREKLDLHGRHGRTQLVAYALTHGIVTSDEIEWRGAT